MRYAGILSGMGTLVMVDFDQHGHRGEGISKRLREQFAVERLSVSEVARKTGMTQSALSRRMTGRLPFAVDELDLICEALGLDFTYTLTGIRDISHPLPAPPDHGRDTQRGANDGARLPWVDSNHQPFGWRVAAVAA